MKKYLAILLMPLLVACGNSDGGGQANAYSEPGELKPFKMTLKIDGYENDYAKLLGIYGDRNFFVDSVQVGADGNAVFVQDTPLAGGLYFVLLSDRNYAEILVDRDQQFTLEFNKNDIVGSMKVKNSLDNELLYKNKRFEAAMKPKFDDVNEKLEGKNETDPGYKELKKRQDNLVEERDEHIQSYVEDYPNAFFTQFKVAGQNPKLREDLGEEERIYQYRMDFWDGVDFSNDKILRTPVYFNKLQRFIKELTPQTKDSVLKYAEYITQKSLGDPELFKFTANWIALQYQKPKIMGLEAVYVHMIDKYWKEDVAFWADKETIDGLRKEVNLMKPSLIGKVGQDIKAKNQHGEYVSMYDLNTPITVLFIFSYECENCQKETPKLIKVYNEWKDKGVGFFSLSIDADRDEWLNYVKKTGMPFNSVFDFERESQYHRKYHIDVTPEIYVLNKDHVIIASNVDSEQLPAIFQRELDKY